MKNIYYLIIIVLLFQCKSKESEKKKELENKKEQIAFIPKKPYEKKETQFEKDKRLVREWKKKVRKRKLEKFKLDTTYQFIDSTVIISGVIQSSGLKGRKNLDFKADFQVTRILKNFFLVTENDLNNYWGKHVRVKGKYLKGYDYFSDELSATAIKLLSIEEIPCDTCTCEPLWTKLDRYFVKDEKRDTILTGYVERMERKIEISSYDYKIKFDKPFMFENFCEFMEKPKKIELKQATLVSKIQIDTMNYIIENNKKVELLGMVEGGHYGCRIVFYCKELKKIY